MFTDAKVQLGNPSCGEVFYLIVVFSVLDPDDFIVDEEGQSVVKKKKKKTIIHDDK